MEIQFNDITAKITKIHQWFTYENLLEGIPTDKMNLKLLNSLPDKAISLTNIENFYIVEPKQTKIDIGRKYPFGEPMSLPDVTCVVGLKFNETSNPKVGGISELTLICFQNEFASPFDKETLSKIANEKWFKYSKDISYDDY